MRVVNHAYRYCPGIIWDRSCSTFKVIDQILAVDLLKFRRPIPKFLVRENSQEKGGFVNKMVSSTFGLTQKGVFSESLRAVPQKGFNNIR